MTTLTFLGSGGGRFAMITQIKGTGGFRLDTENFHIHIDPGPGALIKSLKEKLACGGTVKEGVIELQGDHKRQVKPILVKLGFSENSITN